MQNANAKPLFPALEAFILRSAPAHVAVDNAPENLADLNAWAAAQPASSYGVTPHTVLLPVWNGASDSTIYSSPEVNFAYRAMHDWAHLTLQADVDYADEFRVSVSHFKAARASGLPIRDVLALWYDSHGQNAYHARTGEFVKDQRAFVLACLDNGLGETLNYNW